VFKAWLISETFHPVELH